MKLRTGVSTVLVLGGALLAACSSTPPTTEVAVSSEHKQQPPPAISPPAPAPPNTISYATSVRPTAHALQRSPGILIPYTPPASANKFPDQQANKSILVAEQPVSTLSVDVDTASYALARRMLTAGRMPVPDAVRVEEMVNYFPYKYAAPKSRTQPFAVSTELMPSPWSAGKQLLHIGVRGFDIQAAARPRANVVLLIDVSGSMQPEDRLPLLKKSFRLFAEQLRDDDRVAIVTYANGTNVALEPTTGRDKHKIIDAIDALGAAGGTAGADGLQRAYAMAERHFDRKAVNRVILATDGDFNLGITDPKQLQNFIADKRKSGVYLSVFGVGMGNLNDALIQRMTQTGNGNAAYIDSLLEARKALSDELSSTMFPIANDVKVQVEFNPEQVAAYRLIGYETRMLQRQDFNDDKIDAGDMGAAGQLVDPLRYGKQKDKTTAKASSDELCFVKVRYKLPGETASRLVDHPVRASSARKTLAAVPDDQRFAVAVAAFGQRLRGEAALADFQYAQIAELANGARGADNEGYRAEFVRLVRMAEALKN